jgi:hypothetical protein
MSETTTPILGRYATGAGIVITTCIHGLDLRIYPRCFMCRPLTPSEEWWWLHRAASNGIPAQPVESEGKG